MDRTHVYRRLNEHRQWVNRKLLAAADTLDSVELHGSHEIGQGTLWKTLTHLYGAEFVWLNVLQGDANPLAPGDARGQLPGNQAGESPIQSLEELRLRWEECHTGWNRYLENVKDDALDASVIKQNSVTGIPASARCSDVLIHVHTHAQYTTAQAINILRHSGVDDLPDVMMISLARGEGR